MGGHPGLCWLSPAPAPGSWGAASQGWHTRWHGFDQSCDRAVWSEYEAFQNDSVVPSASGKKCWLGGGQRMIRNELRRGGSVGQEGS